jgi:hypothetical protein
MDAWDIYAVTIYCLAPLGLILAAVRSRRGWRIQMGILAAVTLMWAIALGTVLVDDSVGHECDQADHTGELPSLIIAVAWAAGLIAAAAFPDPPVSRLSVRLGVPLATAGLIGGTILVLMNVQTVGC